MTFNKNQLDSIKDQIKENTICEESLLFFEWSGERDWFSFAPYREDIEETSKEFTDWCYALENTWDESEGAEGACFNDLGIYLGYGALDDGDITTKLKDEIIWDLILQKEYYDLFGYTKEEWVNLKGNPINVILTNKKIPITKLNEKYGDLKERAWETAEFYIKI